MSKYFYLFIAFSSISNGEVMIKLDTENIIYPACDLVWNSQQGSQSSQLSYIDLSCEKAPIGGPSTYVGGTTTVYVNARRYTCPLDLFVFTSTPTNQVVVYLDCRTVDTKQ